MHNDKVILRLSSTAMEALFPEGTQARVDLQNAVLAEAAGRFVKGQLDVETRKYLEALVTTIANKVDAPQMIADAFEKKNQWSSVSELRVKPTSQMTAAIADRVKEEFATGLHDIIDREVSARLPKAIEGIDKKVQDIVDRKVAELTSAMMREKVNAAFAAAGLVPPK